MIENDIKEVYFSKEELHGIVKRLGEQISKDYEGKNLTLVSILKGSVIFMADLMRERCSQPAATLLWYGYR